MTSQPERAGKRLEVIAFGGLPNVEEGDEIASLIIAGAESMGLRLQDGDIIVLAQKIVSKSEGRRIALIDVAPSDRARDLARDCEKDPRLIEVILSESKQVLRARKGLIIVEHRLGFVNASAGVDLSNVGPDLADQEVLLLPIDPDESARRVRDQLAAQTGCKVGVIIADTMGRAWRRGVVGQAIGCAGVRVVWDRIGDPDLYGRALTSTEIAVVDELAAAASFVMGQADEGRAIVLIRGAGEPAAGDGVCREIVRPVDQDMFR